MHILLLTTSFPVTEGTSSGVFVERLARVLGRKCQLSVLAPADDLEAPRPSDKPYELFTFRYAPLKWQILAHKGGGIPATLRANPWSLGLLPFFIVSMFLHCLRYAPKADVIFANWSICGVIAGIVGYILNRPVITTIRGEDANRAQGSGVHRLLIKLCLRMNRRVVTVSNDIAMNLSKLFPVMTHKIMMIPNGVNFIPEAQKHRKADNDERVRLLMVGSLIARKSVATALHALHILPSTFSLTVVGVGPERANLEALAADLNLGERAYFKGHVNPDAITSHFAEADILVMTSTSEGRPNAVLEALAVGVPVVGSDIPGLRELIVPDANGLLFPVGNHKALAACLLRLADQALRLHLGEGGRQFIGENGLTWENTAESYMQEFRRFCCGGNT